MLKKKKRQTWSYGLSTNYVWNATWMPYVLMQHDHVKLPIFLKT